jgi:hypothetical protein
MTGWKPVFPFPVLLSRAGYGTPFGKFRNAVVIYSRFGLIFCIMPGG